MVALAINNHANINSTTNNTRTKHTGKPVYIPADMNRILKNKHEKNKKNIVICR